MPRDDCTWRQTKAQPREACLFVEHRLTTPPRGMSFTQPQHLVLGPPAPGPLFGLWRVCFPPCLVRPGRNLGTGPAAPAGPCRRRCPGRHSHRTRRKTRSRRRPWRGLQLAPAWSCGLGCIGDKNHQPDKSHQRVSHTRHCQNLPGPGVCDAHDAPNPCSHGS